MGCDIHLFVEARQPDGTWKSVDKWETEEEEGYTYVHIPYRDEYYNGRNYNLFAILADVRNGRGFAGIKTGEGFNPIAPPKGLPEDVSAEVKRYSDQMGSDGHSHSWHTVADLLAYDWTQKTTCQGWVNGETFSWWLGYPDDQPEQWCGGVTGPNVEHISNEEMKSRTLACREKRDFSSLENVYTLLRWEVMYSVAVGADWWERTFARLLRLGKPEDVRIVFLFDN